jgi:hypothetical protein
MSFPDWLAAWQSWQHSRLLLQVGPALRALLLAHPEHVIIGSADAVLPLRCGGSI